MPIEVKPETPAIESDPDEHLYIAAFNERYASHELEIDGEELVSVGDDGGWVRCWHFVSKKEAGVSDESVDDSDEDEDDEGEEHRFRNHYRCDNAAEHPNGKPFEWEDLWESTCDDKCPHCNRSISPYMSEDA